jgi:DNA modification methylase
MPEPNLFLNADCLEGMKTVRDGSVDMVLSDLPFGSGTAGEACINTGRRYILMEKDAGLKTESENIHISTQI